MEAEAEEEVEGKKRKRKLHNLPSLPKQPAGGERSFKRTALTLPTPWWVLKERLARGQATPPWRQGSGLPLLMMLVAWLFYLAPYLLSHSYEPEDGPVPPREEDKSTTTAVEAPGAAGLTVHTVLAAQDEEAKPQMLVDLILENRAAGTSQAFAVFVRKASTANALAAELDRLNVGTVALKEDDPSDLIPIYVDEFRMGKYCVLLIPEQLEPLAILSGLDHVSHAINYDLPVKARSLARLSALRIEANGNREPPIHLFTFAMPSDQEALQGLKAMLALLGILRYRLSCPLHTVCSLPTSARLFETIDQTMQAQ